MQENIFYIFKLKDIIKLWIKIFKFIYLYPNSLYIKDKFLI